jgi:xanthine/CO dehydrogenase XdhC/CoxF family maturation factor
VSVLLERSDSAEASDLLAFLDEQRVKREPAVAATVISEGPWFGKKLLIAGGRVCGGGLEGSTLEALVLAHAEQVTERRKSRLARLDAADVFVEYVGPPQSLVIFGAGHDALPLVTIAGQLGWDITVVDGRPAYARAERFPEARRVMVLKGSELPRDLAIGRETAVVLMTHNFPLDARLLPAVLSARPAYVGLLGPRSRAERLLNGMTAPEGVKLHAPIGLDLGGDTPAATALAIAAEVQAALTGRRGGMLSEGSGAIHLPVDEVGPGGFRVLRQADRPAVCETLVGNYA